MSERLIVLKLHRDQPVNQTASRKKSCNRLQLNSLLKSLRENSKGNKQRSSRALGPATSHGWVLHGLFRCEEGRKVSGHINKLSPVAKGIAPQSTLCQLDHLVKRAGALEFRIA